LIFGCLYRLFPSLIDASIVFRPETLLRWRRRGFRLFWRWKSRRRVGRSALSPDIRSLVRRISRENPLWGAPRIHGELLKLGIEIAQSTVAKYMARRRGPPSQGWKTFTRNHAPEIAAIDLFVVPTIDFKLLYGLAIIRPGRRRLVWTSATANPTSEWIARQITEAFPWDEAPRYLIHDRDSSYGVIVRKRIRAMGIRDRSTAPRSPWQNGHTERLIGSIRRGCLDHILALGEAHLRRALSAYADYYDCVRTHLALDKCPSWPSRAGSWIAHGHPPSRWTPSRIRPDGLSGRLNPLMRAEIGAIPRHRAHALFRARVDRRQSCGCLGASDVELDLDIAARGVRVGADILVCLLSQHSEVRLAEGHILDAQSNGKAKPTSLSRADRHRAFDFCIGRVHMLLLGDEIERTAEASRIACRE
jgi:Integrase core domain